MGVRKQPNLHVFITSIAQTKLLSNMQVDQISNLTIFSYDGSCSETLTRIVVPIIGYTKETKCYLTCACQLRYRFISN